MARAHVTYHISMTTPLRDNLIGDTFLSVSSLDGTPPTCPHDLSPIKIVFLDQINDPGPKEEDFPYLKALEGKWMANLGCLASIDRNHGLNVRDDAKPRQQWRN